MARHQIDADPLVRGQDGEIRQDALQQLIRHRQDQPLLLRIGDEGAWRHQIPSSLPAQQCLESHHPSVSAVHYGLIEGDELPPSQPSLQQSFEERR